MTRPIPYPVNFSGLADVVAHMVSDSPLGRLGSASEVAHLVAWLCSDASRFNSIPVPCSTCRAVGHATDEHQRRLSLRSQHIHGPHRPGAGPGVPLHRLPGRCARQLHYSRTHGQSRQRLYVQSSSGQPCCTGRVCRFAIPVKVPAPRDRSAMLPAPWGDSIAIGDVDKPSHRIGVHLSML